MLEWTTLREDNNSIERQASNTVVLEAGDIDLADPDNLAAEIQRQCPELSGPVTLGIASDQLLMRVVELPTVDTAEIQSMAQLQVGKLSPFPDDRMASSYEVLKTTETSCWVFIVTIQRDLVESVGMICQKAGLDVQRMDVEAMGWWRLLTDENVVLDKGRQVIILLESEGGVMVAVQDGIPVSFRAINSRAGLSEEDYVSEIAGEMEALILAMDLEQGAQPVTCIDFLYRGMDPEPITTCLKKEFAQDMRVQSLDALPLLSEGLARRMLVPVFSVKASMAQSQGMRTVVDLFPVEWRMAAASLRVKRHLVMALAVLVGVWIVAMIVLLGGYHLQQRRLKQFEARMALLQKPADRVRLLQRQVRSFEQFLDRKRSALECLREISRLLPDGVELKSFQFKTGHSVLLRGEALSVDPIYDFKQELDKSTLFKGIEMGSVQPQKRKKTTVQTFQMIARMPEDNP